MYQGMAPRKKPIMNLEGEEFIIRRVIKKRKETKVKQQHCCTMNLLEVTEK